MAKRATPRSAADSAPPAQWLQVREGVVICAELALSQEEQQRGLQGREKLPAGQGMLFPLPLPARPVFWMEGVSFPLDLVWLRAGRIVGIEANAPPDPRAQPQSDAPESSPATRPGKQRDAPAEYTPLEPVDAILELAAGEAARLNLRPGDFLLPLRSSQSRPEVPASAW